MGLWWRIDSLFSAYTHPQACHLWNPATHKNSSFSLHTSPSWLTSSLYPFWNSSASPCSSQLMKKGKKFIPEYIHLHPYARKYNPDSYMRITLTYTPFLFLNFQTGCSFSLFLKFRSKYKTVSKQSFAKKKKQHNTLRA